MSQNANDKQSFEVSEHLEAKTIWCFRHTELRQPLRQSGMLLETVCPHVVSIITPSLFPVGGPLM